MIEMKAGIKQGASRPSGSARDADERVRPGRFASEVSGSKPHGSGEGQQDQGGDGGSGGRRTEGDRALKPPRAAHGRDRRAGVGESRPAPKVSVRNLNFYYGDDQALFENNIDIPALRV
ncbi:MAG: hypothetical protein GF400_04435, partial [Candidatus Eisenbacteria bacterium]|nr:hypothetical protein [Candidatus Eisenbacteria bacterium]